MNLLADSFRKYAEYLDYQTKSMQSRHSVKLPLMLMVFILNASVVVLSIDHYSDLHSKIISSKTFEPIFVNDYAQPDPRRYD